MKTQTFGESRGLAREHSGDYGNTGPTSLWTTTEGNLNIWTEESIQEYIAARSNGTEEDNPRYAFPRDGYSCWGSPFIPHRPAHTRYVEGSGDHAWMEKKDRNYIRRLIRENQLDEIEPNLEIEIPKLYAEFKNEIKKYRSKKTNTNKEDENISKCHLLILRENMKLMKTQSFGVSDAKAYCSHSHFPEGIQWRSAQAKKNYRDNRENGTEDDNPKIELPFDGKEPYYWKDESLSGEDGYEWYRVRYDEGPGDRAWMEEKDRNYISRLIKEGRLDEVKPNLESEMPRLFSEFKYEIVEMRRQKKAEWAKRLAREREIEQKAEVQRKADAEAKHLAEIELEKKAKEEAEKKRLAEIAKAEAKKVEDLLNVLNSKSLFSGLSPEIKVEIPNYLLCPISGKIMVNPVVTATGQTYEREEIENWFRTQDTDPINKSKLQDITLKTNDFAANALQDFYKKNPGIKSSNMVYLSKKLLLDLKEAIEKHNLNDVKRLIQQDPRALGYYLAIGRTAFHLACEQGTLEILEYIISCLNAEQLKLLNSLPRPEKWNPVIANQLLFKAVNDLSIDKINQALSYGADLEGRDADGKTALCLAAEVVDLELVEYLLQKGANKSARDNKKDAALDIALRKNNDQIVFVLLEKGLPDYTPTGPEDPRPHYYSMLMFMHRQKKEAMATQRSQMPGDGSASQPVKPTPTSPTSPKAPSTEQPSTPEPAKPVQIPPPGATPADAEKPSPEVSIHYKDLIFGARLGEGAFGVVYQGEYQHAQVAIKQLLIKDMSATTLEEFKRESNIMAKLRHPNVVQYLGACYEPAKYCIVMELMPNNSLYKLLHNGQPLEWTIRYNIVRDITAGLTHLHAQNIIHRDLKSLNVLLDMNLRAKLTDFGLSKVKNESKSTTNQANKSVGTINWMAPEIFSLKPKYSKKSDMYAYGMILWEIATRKDPFEDADPIVVREEIKKGATEEIPEDIATKYPRYSELIKNCWLFMPETRPDIEAVGKGFRKLAIDDNGETEVVPIADDENKESYVNPKLNSGPNYDHLTNR